MKKANAEFLAGTELIVRLFSGDSLVAWRIENKTHCDSPVDTLASLFGSRFGDEQAMLGKHFAKSEGGSILQLLANSILFDSIRVGNGFLA